MRGFIDKEKLATFKCSKAFSSMEEATNLVTISGYRVPLGISSDLLFGNFFITKDECCINDNPMDVYNLRFVGRDGYPIVIRGFCGYKSIDDLIRDLESIDIGDDRSKIELIAREDYRLHEYPVYESDFEYLKVHKQKFRSTYEQWESGIDSVG